MAPVLDQAARLLDMLAEQGRLTGKSSKAGQLFCSIASACRIFWDACPPLASLGYFWRELRQERGGRMDELLRLVDLLAGHLRRWAASMAV